MDGEMGPITNTYKILVGKSEKNTEASTEIDVKGWRM